MIEMMKTISMIEMANTDLVIDVVVLDLPEFPLEWLRAFWSSVD